MGNLLNEYLCDELTNVINETDIFIIDEEESKKFHLICALICRFDQAVNYINKHQNRLKSEAELIIFMVYSCIIKDGIDYIKDVLKIEKSEDKKIFENIYRKPPINIPEKEEFNDDKFFSYFRSLLFVHPLFTNKSIPKQKEGEIQYSPYILIDPQKKPLDDLIKIKIYSNKREDKPFLSIPFKNLKEYIKVKYEELNQVIEGFRKIISEKEIKWKEHKVNRNQEDIDILKDCINILEERRIDTYGINELITYLTCENSLEENIENVNKYRNEIKKIIPSICDALDSYNHEEIYNIVSVVLRTIPKAHQMMNYQLEKIFEYLNDYNHIESMEWGLKQAEAFSKKFAKKWVIIKPQEMDFDEIKMLIRVACYLEYMEQKEGKNE